MGERHGVTAIEELFRDQRRSLAVVLDAQDFLLHFGHRRTTNRLELYRKAGPVDPAKPSTAVSGGNFPG